MKYTQIVSVARFWGLKEQGGRLMNSSLVELDEEYFRKFRKTTVFGDLHGDYRALQTGLSIVDPGKDGIIFLGDYGDRGPAGVEVIDAIDSLIKRHARNVFALKGNHEEYAESGEPEFWPSTLIDEAKEKRGDWQNYFQNKFKPFLGHLHLAVIVHGEALFVHGGISSKITSLNDLKNPTKDIEKDILWSDPFEGSGEHPNWDRGMGVEFGTNVTTSVCKTLGVKRIIRSHQPSKALSGPFYSHGHRVMTINSTSVYGGKPFLLEIKPSTQGLIYLTRDLNVSLNF